MPLGFSPDAGMGAQHMPPPIHCPAPRTPERGSPFDPFDVPGGNAKKDRKNKDSRQMVVPPPMPTNVDKENSVQHLPPTGKVHRKLNFEKPTLPDVAQRITRRTKARVREIIPVSIENATSLAEDLKYRHSRLSRSVLRAEITEQAIADLESFLDKEGNFPAIDKLVRKIERITREAVSGSLRAPSSLRKTAKLLGGNRKLSNQKHLYKNPAALLRRWVDLTFEKIDEEEGRKRTQRRRVQTRTVRVDRWWELEYPITEEDFNEVENIELERLSQLYPESHDPKVQPPAKDDLLEIYPEARDPRAYLEKLRTEESRNQLLFMIDQYREKPPPVEKIRRASKSNGDNGNEKPQSGRPDRNKRRAIIRQKTGENVSPETFLPNSQTQASPGHMTQQ